MHRKGSILFKVVKILFIVPNQKYNSFFTSLLVSYLVLVIPAFVKLIRIILQFPGNRLYSKLILLSIFFSLTICAGFSILIERLSSNFYRKKLLRKKLSKTEAEYKKTQKIYKQSQVEKNPNDKILKKIQKMEAKLLKCSTRINDLDTDSLRISLPSVIKLAFFIFLLLEVNRYKLVLLFLISISELACVSLLSRINTLTVSLLSILKELFSFFLFVFMCMTKEMHGAERLDHYLDILVAVYFILYWIVTFLIYKRVNLILPQKK